MNNKFFDLKELQDIALNFARENPLGALAAVAAIVGISKGITDGISKLGPTLEKCWKYTVDKATKQIPNPATKRSSTDDSHMNVIVGLEQDNAVAA